MKTRRRGRPEGVRTPKELKMDALLAEAKRRSTCITWCDDEGYPHDYHEPKGEISRTYTWDAALRRSASPVECVHCGRKGFYVILELSDHWDDPLAVKEEKAS